jgi:hypothetical protein
MKSKIILGIIFTIVGIIFLFLIINKKKSFNLDLDLDLTSPIKVDPNYYYFSTAENDGDNVPVYTPLSIFTEEAFSKYLTDIIKARIDIRILNLLAEQINSSDGVIGKVIEARSNENKAEADKLIKELDDITHKKEDRFQLQLNDPRELIAKAGEAGKFVSFANGRNSDFRIINV